MDALDFYDFQVLVHRDRGPRIVQERLDPFALSDNEFKKHFRFSKTSVRELVMLLEPDLLYDTINPVLI